jgi:hypothetical protein
VCVVPLVPVVQAQLTKDILRVDTFAPRERPAPLGNQPPERGMAGHGAALGIPRASLLWWYVRHVDHDGLGRLALLTH